ncbi:unnamed protein product [Clavelina lepadiformis]|uniref:Uncharacterized protein n=1 Tax=Clavelina lepadiformis TaxID=159417 RepID=A0ABP0GDQ3_CLALP
MLMFVYGFYAVCLCWLTECQTGTFGRPIGTPRQDVTKGDCPDTNNAWGGPSAVNYNQQILLIGGIQGWFGHCYNSVEMLDLNDENPKWDSNLSSMGENRSAFASTLLNGLVYCAGGSNDNGRLSSCESYNPE